MSRFSPNKNGGLSDAEMSYHRSITEKSSEALRFDRMKANIFAGFYRTLSLVGVGELVVLIADVVADSEKQGVQNAVASSNAPLMAVVAGAGFIVHKISNWEVEKVGAINHELATREQGGALPPPQPGTARSYNLSPDQFMPPAPSFGPDYPEVPLERGPNPWARPQ